MLMEFIIFFYYLIENPLLAVYSQLQITLFKLHPKSVILILAKNRRILVIWLAPRV